MYVGVDIGSRTVKAAAIENGKLADYHVAESGFDPCRQSIEIVKKYHPHRIVATGYGRHLARENFADEVITEIKAHAIGARYFYPDCDTVIDVGGQDSKVISLDASGRVVNFHMNDKCAAGTGRFLEIMAQSLGFDLSDFGRQALKGKDGIKINSMCTVFAESEVISLKNNGRNPLDIAKAVHLSVVEKLVVLLHKVGYHKKIVFSGGVAKNECIVKTLQEAINLHIDVPRAPDIVGAVGSALFAERQK